MLNGANIISEKIDSKLILKDYLDLLSDNFIDYNKRSTMLLNENEYIEYLKEVYTLVFGKNAYEIEKLLEKTIYNPKDKSGTHVSFGHYNYENEYKVVVKRIILAEEPSFESVLGAMHEYTHCLESFFDFTSNNYFKEEIYAILIEKVSSIILSNITDKREIFFNQEKFRFNGACSCSKKILSLQSKINQNNSVDIKKQQLDYLSHLVSDLYASLLLNYYHQDPRVMITKIREILIYGQKIDTILKYYNINLQDNKSYQTIEKKLKLLKSTNY